MLEQNVSLAVDVVQEHSLTQITEALRVRVGSSREFRLRELRQRSGVGTVTSQRMRGSEVVAVLQCRAELLPAHATVDGEVCVLPQMLDRRLHGSLSPDRAVLRAEVSSAQVQLHCRVVRELSGAHTVSAGSRVQEASHDGLRGGRHPVQT